MNDGDDDYQGSSDVWVIEARTDEFIFVFDSERLVIDYHQVGYQLVLAPYTC